MFEEAPDDGAHADVLRHAGYAGAQRAHAAHDEVHAAARARRGIQAPRSPRGSVSAFMRATIRPRSPRSGLRADQLQQSLVQA